jgi:S1-C subfamily serine protease
MLLDDGKEVPAEIVLRDKDLDLAFIRPKTSLAAPLPALDLSKSAKVDVLDQVVALNRLGKAANRAYAASIERIAAIVQKPRLFYVPDSNLTQTSLGSPAFNLDGQVIGLFVMRATKSSGGMMGMMSGGTGFMTAVIVPADDVLKAAKQAPPTKPPEKSEENGQKKE